MSESISQQLSDGALRQVTGGQAASEAEHIDAAKKLVGCAFASSKASKDRLTQAQGALLGDQELSKATTLSTETQAADMDKCLAAYRFVAR